MNWNNVSSVQSHALLTWHYLTWHLHHATTADIRKVNQRNYGRTIAINMQDLSLSIYKITSEERETLRIARTNLGGNFIKQRMPKTGSSLDTFNIPINHINPRILIIDFVINFVCIYILGCI